MGMEVCMYVLAGFGLADEILPPCDVCLVLGLCLCLCLVVLVLVLVLVSPVGVISDERGDDACIE